MLERDDRRECRTSGVSSQNFGAVDGVPLHDHELLVGELVRLVQNLVGRPHLADVVHQRCETELAQQRTVDAEASRLGHGQDRHVDHVCEGVVVVVLQCREGHQRRPVLQHCLRQPVDHGVRGGRIRLLFTGCAFPHDVGH